MSFALIFSDFVGHWSDEGCEVKSSNEHNTTCECNHLTNFAILMSAANRPVCWDEDLVYLGLSAFYDFDNLQKGLRHFVYIEHL